MDGIINFWKYFHGGLEMYAIWFYLYSDLVFHFNVTIMMVFLWPDLKELNPPSCRSTLDGSTVWDHWREAMTWNVAPLLYSDQWTLQNCLNWKTCDRMSVVRQTCLVEETRNFSKSWFICFTRDVQPALLNYQTKP